MAIYVDKVSSLVNNVYIFLFPLSLSCFFFFCLKHFPLMFTLLYMTLILSSTGINWSSVQRQHGALSTSCLGGRHLFPCSRDVPSRWTTTRSLVLTLGKRSTPVIPSPCWCCNQPGLFYFSPKLWFVCVLYIHFPVLPLPFTMNYARVSKDMWNCSFWNFMRTESSLILLPLPTLFHSLYLLLLTIPVLSLFLSYFPCKAKRVFERVFQSVRYPSLVLSFFRLRAVFE